MLCIDVWLNDSHVCIHIPLNSWYIQLNQLKQSGQHLHLSLKVSRVSSFLYLLPSLSSCHVTNCSELPIYLLFSVPGCEDLIAESISVDNLVSVLNWSREPHGSQWVYRQALYYLREEFLQIAHSPVLCDLSKEYMLHAIQSDFLQVS